MGWYNPFLSATSYGRALRPTGSPDEYSLRIYTGGFAGGGTADQRASEVLDNFKSANGYSTYRVVARTSRWFPSCYDYVVRFAKA